MIHPEHLAELQTDAEVARSSAQSTLQQLSRRYKSLTPDERVSLLAAAAHIEELHGMIHRLSDHVMIITDPEELDARE